MVVEEAFFFLAVRQALAHILSYTYLSLFILGESPEYRASERLSVGTDATL